MTARGTSPDPGYPATPSLTVAAVARRLGIAAPTLRTWDRRYGIGPSGRVQGAHRRYTPADVARLEVMRRLTLEGVSSAEAARIALNTDVPAPAGTDPGPSARWPPASPPGEVDETRRLHGAAGTLDADLIGALIRASLRHRGVVPTWQALLLPVLVKVGERFGTTGAGIEVEHLLTECVRTELHRHIRAPRRPVNARPVLLAAVAGEQHSLPLYALAAALAERQVSTRVLGGQVPGAALAAAVRRSGPVAVFLWARMPGLGTPEYVASVPAVRPAPAVVLGGPGWPQDRPRDRPRDRPPVLDLAEAVQRLVGAVS
jgi:DNA-binding transcriptional MerR regulator